MASMMDATGVCSQTIEDAAVQAAMQPWIAMECYQLSHGKQIAEVATLNLGSQQIVRESQDAAVQKLGIMPQNLCTISYCTPARTFRFSELRASNADTIFFMPECAEFDLYVPAGAQTAYVSFNQEEFLRGARTLNPMQWEQAPDQILSIHTRQQAGLKELIDASFQAAEDGNVLNTGNDNKIVSSMLLHDVLQLVATTQADDAQPSLMERARALHVCRAARALVDERLAVDEIPTIVDICATIGVSERSLQYAFRTYVDTSPLAYLRLCRLNRVRTSLRMADPLATTVTEVAMRFGFVHLGRFALDYKRVFGEAPSRTLAI